MKYSPLGTSGLEISCITLGTMTWGVKNTQTDADEQIAYALDQGVNFIDTAEMYPIPPTAERAGDTERIIGDWISRNKDKRKDFYLATKIAPELPWFRDGTNLNRKSVCQAVDTSLDRLQTDSIGLYQLHWGNRTSPHFAKHWPNDKLRLREQDISDTPQQLDGILDTLRGLNDCLVAGKIRHIGLSNETPWGLAQYLRLAAEHDLPRIVSVQNELNLLHTKDWPFLLESCAREQVTYLAWSPIGGGALSGKYASGVAPEGTRWSIAQRNGLFRDTANVHKAVESYSEIARKYNITTAQLALLWVDYIDGVTSAIIGATTMEQLKENIAVAEMELTEDMATDILAVLKEHPAPF